METLLLGLGTALVVASGLLATGGAIVWLGRIAYLRSKQK